MPGIQRGGSLCILDIVDRLASIVQVMRYTIQAQHPYKFVAIDNASLLCGSR